MTAHAKGCRDQFRAWRLICSCRISPNLSRRTSLFLALPRTSRDGKPIFAVFDGPSLRFRAHVDLDQSQSQHRDAYLSMSIKCHIFWRARSALMRKKDIEDIPAQATACEYFGHLAHPRRGPGLCMGMPGDL